MMAGEGRGGQGGSGNIRPDSDNFGHDIELSGKHPSTSLSELSSVELWIFIPVRTNKS